MKHAYHLLFGLFAVIPLSSYGQLSCAGLEILSLEYAPFTDTALQVIVVDTSGSLFSGPYFSLIDSNGDTIAREQQHFFGLTSMPSAHRLDLLPGAPLPDALFEGTLVLRYLTVDGEWFCNIPVEVDLCPPDECIGLMVVVYNANVGQDTASFQWNITNGMQEVVADGILEIDTPAQEGALAQLCLVPGEYELEVQQIGANGVGFQAGLTQGNHQLGVPYEEFDAGEGIQIPFTYYSSCVASGMVIEEDLAPTLQLVVNDGTLVINEPSNEPLGNVVILDASGRRVRSVNSKGPEITIDLSGLAAGVYLVDQIGKKAAARRFLLK